MRVKIVTNRTVTGSAASSLPADQRLSIRTFGALSVALGAEAQPIHFATHTAEALLVYLACQNRPVGRDELAELLWPERAQAQSRMNLRVALHRLRSQIEPYLLIARTNLAVNPDGIDLDVRQFENHLAVGQLTQATALYRSDFLDGFYLDSSPAFEQWLLLERERLRTLAIAAWQQLVDQNAAAGMGEAAIACARRLLQFDPLHEPTHRQIMRLLAQAGQRSAALAQYETCRTLLAAELDVPPDLTTTALYEQIRTNREPLAQAPAGDRTAAVAVGDTGPSREEFVAARPFARLEHTLPPQPTALIGRSTELAHIDRLLANPDCRLLTLLGTGGIGKTRLAVEAAQQAPGVRFSDGVCYVSLASVETAELVWTALAQALELQITGSDLRAEVTAALQSRTLLLVLDNFEHLLEATDLIAHLLQRAAGITFLVTSRERLYLREEWILPIAGLSLAGGLSGEAGQLFLRSAQRVQPGFSAIGQEQAIEAICARVEGLPLAVELAASWVRVIPCADIASRLLQDSQLLTTTLSNLPERHRSLANLLDQSWRLLSPLEQSVLRRVSVFRGGWMLEEAEQVAGATLLVLLGLVDKSLVRADGQGRFDLHELVRQYAAERLAASGEVELARDRHLAAYLRLFRTGDGYLRSVHAAPWLARLDPELDNQRAAVAWAFEQRRYADVAWLLFATIWFSSMRGLSDELSQWSQRLLVHRHLLPLDLRAAILLQYFINSRASTAVLAPEHLGEEIRELVAAGANRIFAAAYWHFAACFCTDLAAATAAWERSIADARAARDLPPLGPEFGILGEIDYLLASVFSAYGHRLIEHGRFGPAMPLVTESLALYEEIGAPYDRAEILGVLGHVALLQGDLLQAYTHLHAACTLAEEYAYRSFLTFWPPLLALVLLYRGEGAASRQLLEASLRLCTELREQNHLSRVCGFLAEVALVDGDLVQAVQWLRQCVDYRNGALNLNVDGMTQLLVAARLAAAQQQYGRAATLFGLVDHVYGPIYAAIRGPIRSLADDALVLVQGSLGPDAFDQAYSAGQHLALEDAFACMLG